MRPNNLDILKVALQRVELTSDPSRDSEAARELKNVLVGKIAKLELVKAIEASQVAMPDDAEIAKLPLADDEDVE
ncbi:MAG: hypothetical protein ACLPH3_07295 [Terracidiphilus sp.]